MAISIADFLNTGMNPLESIQMSTAMRARPTIEQLERRVEALEKKVNALNEDPKALRERARNLIIKHLKAHDSIVPSKFAARNDLPADVVEKVLKEFDRKRWTVPVDD